MDFILKILIMFLFMIISVMPLNKIETEVDSIEYNDKKKANIYKQLYLLYGMYIFAAFMLLVALLMT